MTKILAQRELQAARAFTATELASKREVVLNGAIERVMNSLPIDLISALQNMDNNPTFMYYTRKIPQDVYTAREFGKELGEQVSKRMRMPVYASLHSDSVIIIRIDLREGA